MGRKRNTHPVVKTTIQVSQDAYNFLNSYRHVHEPFYLAVNRLIGYYKQKDVAEVVEQYEQAKKTIAKLYEKIHEQELELSSMKKMKQTVLEFAK